MKEIIQIKGMHCNSCKMLIEEVLDDESVKASVSLEKETCEIEYDESKISLDDIKKMIREENFKVN